MKTWVFSLLKETSSRPSYKDKCLRCLASSYGLKWSLLCHEWCPSSAIRVQLLHTKFCCTFVYVRVHMCVYLTVALWVDKYCIWYLIIVVNMVYNLYIKASAYYIKDLNTYLSNAWWIYTACPASRYVFWPTGILTYWAILFKLFPWV